MRFYNLINLIFRSAIKKTARFYKNIYIRIGKGEDNGYVYQVVETCWSVNILAPAVCLAVLRHELTIISVFSDVT